MRAGPAPAGQQRQCPVAGDTGHLPRVRGLYAAAQDAGMFNSYRQPGMPVEEPIMATSLNVGIPSNGGNANQVVRPQPPAALIIQLMSMGWSKEAAERLAARIVRG